MKQNIGTFYEFFAGAGMARAGLADGWRCLFANDIEPRKAATYAQNWGGEALLCGDINDLTADQLPDCADLAWASFPCQDLSLAGSGAGLDGERSGTFWAFWRLMQELGDESRAPGVIALENVCGTITSHGGRDFKAICRALRDGGYRYGPLVVDAALFLPQSRPRLLIVAVREEIDLSASLLRSVPHTTFHSSALRAAASRLPLPLQENWLWWNAPTPPPRKIGFADLLEEAPADVDWHSPGETQRLLDMMSEVNLAKLDAAQADGRRIVGTLYKRTRRDKFGNKAQRAEVRFDNVAGCLRTPAGGSSRQLVLVVEGGKVRSRLISSRETARLMGLPDDYALPTNYNEAYHLTGDGVVVPVVRFIAKNLIEPVIAQFSATRRAA